MKRSCPRCASLDVIVATTEHWPLFKYLCEACQWTFWREAPSTLAPRTE